LLTQHRAKVSFANNTALALYVLAIAVTVLGLLPVCWHFLLRRLREISAAIRGE
jgi:hypothetical protein